jgi:hypothetical protein
LVPYILIILFVAFSTMLFMDLLIRMTTIKKITLPIKLIELETRNNGVLQRCYSFFFAISESDALK